MFDPNTRVSHKSRTTPITCTEWHNFSSPGGFLECTARELRVPKCDIYGLSVYSVFFLVLVSSLPLMQTPSALVSALDLEDLSITDQRLFARMAITTTTHTRAHPTAITALTGLRAAFSSAQVPGSVSGVALASGTGIVSLIVVASTVVVALVVASMVDVALITASEVVTSTVVVSMAAASAVRASTAVAASTEA